MQLSLSNIGLVRDKNVCKHFFKKHFSATNAKSQKDHLLKEVCETSTATARILIMDLCESNVNVRANSTHMHANLCVPTWKELVLVCNSIYTSGVWPTQTFHIACAHVQLARTFLLHGQHYQLFAHCMHFCAVSMYLRVTSTICIRPVLDVV